MLFSLSNTWHINHTVKFRNSPHAHTMNMVLSVKHNRERKKKKNPADAVNFPKTANSDSIMMLFHPNTPIHSCRGLDYPFMCELLQALTTAHQI